MSPTNSMKKCCVHDLVIVGACVGIESIKVCILEERNLVLVLALGIICLYPCRNTKAFVFYFEGLKLYSFGNNYILYIFYRFRMSSV